MQMPDREVLHREKRDSTRGRAIAQDDADGGRPTGVKHETRLAFGLLAEWEKGHDAVYAVRQTRREKRLKVAFYKLFYRALTRLSDVPMPLDAGDFCLL